MLEICIKNCSRSMTVKDILNNKCCNSCDVPYLYLESLPAMVERIQGILDEDNMFCKVRMELIRGVLEDCEDLGC